MLRGVHKNVVDQRLGAAINMLGAPKGAHRGEAGVVEGLVGLTRHLNEEDTARINAAFDPREV